MKNKELTIRGITLSVSQWKKRRDQIMKGFAVGAFDKDKHIKHWEEFEEIRKKLQEANEY